MANKSNKNIVGSVVKTVDGDYAFTDENEVVKVADKPKRVRKIDPMPIKVAAVHITPTLKVFGLFTSSVIAMAWSVDTVTGVTTSHTPDEKFFEIIESLLGGRNIKKYTIAQFATAPSGDIHKLFAVTPQNG